MRRTTVVVGGGIVGLAAARAIALRQPDTRVVVLEKETEVALHQTGRNSGVIHSGIYYKPGSLKARTCIEGRRALLAFCAEHGIAHEVCGKVIVATDEAELPRLDALAERGSANGIRVRRLGGAELREREPAAAGIAALLVDDAGIVDYAGVCRALVEEIARGGGDVRTGCAVERIERTRSGVRVVGAWGALDADALVNCAGLHCDRVARAAGHSPSARIVPFRGEYYRLRASAPPLCRHLIYPVPDPAFPFLGVHLTRMVDGTVECGPNAVLALGREAYSWGEFSARDAAEMALFPGMWRLMARHWRAGLGEVRRSLFRGAFVRALQRLVPDLRAEHIEPAPAGIRAQAMEPSGALVDDFRVDVEAPCIHVLNAPSPAATASLAIGERIADYTR